MYIDVYIRHSLGNTYVGGERNRGCYLLAASAGHIEVHRPGLASATA